MDTLVIAMLICENGFFAIYFFFFVKPTMVLGIIA